MTAGLIDLDAAPPGPAETGNRPRTAVPRPARVLALVALVLAAMGASVVPPRGIERVLSSGGTAAAAFALGPDALYTAQFGANPSAASLLRAYRLSDGARVWSRALDQNVQGLDIDPAARVLMARSGTDLRTAFLDADTGALLWRTAEPDSTVVTLTRGRALIRTDLGPLATSLRMVDARTGRTWWTRTIDPAAELGPDELYGDAPSRVVAVGATGSVTVLDWAGGAVLSRGDLHVNIGVAATPPLPPDTVAVSMVGDRLYVSRRRLGGTSTTAYSTVPLAEVWTAAGGPVGQVTDCGPVLCVTDTRWVSGLDPATGAVRWADPDWSAAFRYGAGRLFAFDQQETPQAALLDAATGTVISRLGRTSFLGRLTLTTDDRAPGRVLVGESGRTDGTPHPVGAVAGVVAYACVVRDRYLACPTEPGPTTVWEVP
jgi:hypothetical protein